MLADLIIHSADQLLTLKGGPQRGMDLGSLDLIKDGAIAIADGVILAVGTSADILNRYPTERRIDAGGQVLLPGFVDPHTHVLWVGERAAEFEQRVAGASYMEIMAGGGGIMATVRKVRQADLGQLMDESRPRLQRVLRHGTTTVEAKSGYGLSTTAELRILEAAMRLNQEGPWELAPTFLGAHAIPAEYRDEVQAYTDLVSHEMLPAVLHTWQEQYPQQPLPFVDVFCEKGAFDIGQSRQILSQAKALGFPLKIHADEFEGLGGTALAVELGAVSADHLVRTPQSDIHALGQSDTVAVALPCTPFGLAESAYTPAQAILDANGILALATDLNPGTAWCESMQFPIVLACRYMGLTQGQAIAAATINAAAAISRSNQIGSLEPGKQADMILLDVPDYRHLGYRFGSNLVTTVVKKGKVVVRNRTLEENAC